VKATWILRDPQKAALLLDDLISVMPCMAVTRPPNTTEHELETAVDDFAEGPIWIGCSRSQFVWPPPNSQGQLAARSTHPSA
jgi:hypothetical protein